MKISAKTQYACIALIELATNYEENQLIRIKTISEIHSISSRFLVQILLQLKTAGLVTSARGATGGYQLARSPEEISLGDIFNAVEDRTGDAQLGMNGTPVSQLLGNIWNEVQQQEQRILRNYTLADLVEQLQEPNELNYHI